MDADTVVIGAGPAGLAVTACLKQRGVDPIVLERKDVVGSAWHNHYERLHLHTIKRFSSLPMRPFPAGYPQYVSRQQVVDYLVDYAEHFGIAPRFGETVEAVRPVNGHWETTSSSGTLRSRHVVVATGYSGVPKVPEWPGTDAYEGELLHSSAYRNGSKWRGKRAMVVGAGNSGAEIAIDLFEHGADTTLCVRGAIHVMPRDLMGVPSQITGLTVGRLPTPIADRVASGLLKLAGWWDLSELGLRRPEIGPATMVVKMGRIPLIDIGTVDLIRQGHIQVRPGIERFTASGVVFEDGRQEEFDAVVLATGYRPALDRFLGDRTAEVTDYRGYPSLHGTESQLPGLWFLGFRNPITGQLRDIAIEARRVAGEIGARR